MATKTNLAVEIVIQTIQDSVINLETLVEFDKNYDHVKTKFSTRERAVLEVAITHLGKVLRETD